MAELLRIGMVQANIAWEQKEVNFTLYSKLLSKLEGKADVAVMPEMFATGFTMNAAGMSETNDGPTMQHVAEWSKCYKMALCGSFIAHDGEQYFNRAFFAKPDGSICFYDKRHLFRMAQEDRYFASGNKQLIIDYQGWNICLQVCYDLRFPVWSRNVGNAYDLIIYVANWPESRRNAWISLLQARAIENLSYVCGVNRAGANGEGIMFHGDSMLFSFKGERMANLGKRANSVRIVNIEKASLERFRQKFPAWRDADQFTINP